MVKRMRKVLPDNLSSMAEAFLSPLWVSTAGETETLVSWWTKEFPKGPHSAPVYTIYSLTNSQKRMSAAPRYWADVQVVLFPDDVLLSAKSPSALQGLLDIATRRADEQGMRWNTKRGKSEILMPDETKTNSFRLAGKTLSTVSEVTYLRISLSQSGLTDAKLLGRKKAKIAVYQLRKLGIFKKGLSAQKCIKLYKALIQPRWEYALHLMPLTQEV